MSPHKKTIPAKLTLGILASFALIAQAHGTGLPDALRDAAMTAVTSSPEVQIRWHAFRMAEEEQAVARGGFLPQVDAVASSGTEWRNRPGASSDRFGRSGVAISLNQMVYDGFFTRNEVKRLGRTKLARYYEVLDASETAALEAAAAYIDVLRFRELVQLAQHNYAEHRMVHAQITERVSAGVGRRVDLEQATGRLALAESNLLTEVSNLHDVSARYLRIVGSAPAADLPPLAAFFPAEQMPVSVHDGLRQAFQTSPTLNAAVENVLSGAAQVEAVRAAFQPRVDLRARQSVDHNRDNLSGRSREGVVEVVMSYNLYRGGSDTARLRQAAEAQNQSRDLREKACRDLRQNYSIAYNDAVKLREQLGYLEQHMLSTARTREAYRQQFDIGQRSLLDLLDNENEYFQASRVYESARHDLLISEARTLALKGRLMSSLGVARDSLPALSDLGQDRDGIDPDSICPPESPTMLDIDKQAVFEEAMRAAGRR